MPVFIVPDKLLIESNFLAGSFTSMMPPKVAVKVNLPFGYLRLARSLLIIIFRIFYATVIKLGLQFFYICKGMLHRREQQLLPNSIKHSMLFSIERIVLQEGVKLCLIPQYTCSSATASPQASRSRRKSIKFLATGCT